MSLVSTWVRFADGNWRKNPVIHGHLALGTETLAWFICFDDDEPPELVVELADFVKADSGNRARLRSYASAVCVRLLTSYQLKVEVRGDRALAADRCFSRSAARVGVKAGAKDPVSFKPAVGVFVDLEAPLRFDAAFTDHEGESSSIPEGDSVLFDLSGLPQDWLKGRSK